MSTNPSPSTRKSAISETFALGDQWPTLDPFLFCAHHNDHFPAANAQAGPVADLSGREMGSDFANIDGWNMYHGDTVPGFPSHPHRGFETISIVRTGLLDHSDSVGARARYGHGDVQWLTAGSGIQHAEMFPLLNRDGANPAELFQVWLNLPARSKMVEPHFTMFWANDIPQFTAPGVVVDVIAGHLDGAPDPLAPPPASWAADPASGVAVWRISLQPGAEWVLPRAADGDVNRVVYLFEGDGIRIDDLELPGSTGAVVDSAVDVRLLAGDTAAELLMLQGRPIGEPVARYGPFVMNTMQQIAEAFDDYRSTQFGGWPWDRFDPVHGPAPERFAEHSDGRRESPPASVRVR